jgi:hypothetical protein
MSVATLVMLFLTAPAVAGEDSGPSRPSTTSGAAPLGGPALLVQRSRVAGLIHHAGPTVWAAIEPGSTVALVREATNPHDERAVRIDWQGITLGYLPRRENDAVAWALDHGESLAGHIRPHPVRHGRHVAFEIEITLH